LCSEKEGEDLNKTEKERWKGEREKNTVKMTEFWTGTSGKWPSKGGTK